MYEPWGYQEANNYVSKKSIVEDDLAESKKNDKQELKDIEELKKSKVDNVSYDKNENKIVFFANQKEVASVDTTDFVKDGMIESVELDGTVLKIIFNTESGKEEIDVDFKDIISGGTFYTKDEVDSKLDEKADKSDIPSMDEYAKTADVQTEIENAVSGKADSSDVYAKSEVDAKLDEKADKSDIPSLDEYAKTADVQAEIEGAVSGKADSSDVEAIEAQITPISSDITALKDKDDELQEAIDLKASQADFEALSSNVYTKEESDEKFLTEHQSLSGYATEAWVNEQGFLTEHQDISNLATKDEVISGETELWESLNAEQAARIQNDDEIYSAITDVIETKQDKGDYVLKETYDAMVQEKDAEISGLNASVYSLKKIVGDIGGAVTYDLPGEGKSFNTLMNNNGTVKLSEDVETGRFGPGITASNHVKLNLNTHDLTISGLTTSSAQAAIMARGTQEITIYGKGTVDSGQGICIEGNGANSVINLTGSTTIYRNDRSGGELIYCYSGTINIINGTFRNDGEDKKYLLNCYDANYANGTAKIIVTGGKFYDFNPADNSAEGEHTNFVAEGYHVETSTVVEEEVEHTIYTVKKD